MTYLTYETSAEGSKPVEVYTLGIGSNVWRYTSAEDEITIGGETYTPVPVERTNILMTLERSEALEISLPATNEFVAQYIGVPPGVVASIQIQRFQRSDPDEELQTEFIGIVQSLKFTEDFQKCVLGCYWHVAKASRPIPRFRCGAQCNYMLGDNNCKVNLHIPAFEFSGAVSAVNGSIITVPGLSGTYVNDWFTGGMVSIPSLGDYRMVLDHAGNDLTLMLPFHANVVGVTVEVEAGCDYSLEGDCALKFDNVIEFGGFNWVPSKNPFTAGIDP
jgi:uncharacterized phage protein (TIGR02218 family)